MAQTEAPARMADSGKTSGVIRNSLGREIPDSFLGRTLRPYGDPFSFRPTGMAASRPVRRINPTDSGHIKVESLLVHMAMMRAESATD